MPTRELTVGTRVRIATGKHAGALAAVVRCPARNERNRSEYFVQIGGQEVGPFSADELEVQVFGA